MLSIPCYWYFVPVAALIALGMAFFFYRFMKRQPDGNRKMKAIAHFVRVGAFAYLRRQYKTVSIVFAVLFVIERESKFALYSAIYTRRQEFQCVGFI